MAEDARQRALDKIAQLAGQGSDLVTFWEESSEVLAQAVPHYASPCWYTLDPASLLMTSHFQPGVPEFPRLWLEMEYLSDDVNHLADVARSDRGLSTLHEATGGDPSSSPRWQVNMAYGGDQEMIARLRTRSGEVWGAFGLYREPGESMFDADDIGFVQAVSPYLAEGARRALLVGEATEPETPDGPGLVVLSGDFTVESTTPGVERWLAELPDGDWDAGRLPTAVLSVAARAMRTAERRTSPGRSPSSGCWPAPAPGWCCTAPRSCPTARAGSRSSSSPRTPRASRRC
ncbi:MAG: transcriptional regulator, LuxR family [Pseudonocardia sp.]|nr:transcriptional regulator, LuxR family [Pseudonocardia sp.]